jgi:hypothetical protein
MSFKKADQLPNTIRKFTAVGGATAKLAKDPDEEDEKATKETKEGEKDKITPYTPTEISAAISDAKPRIEKLKKKQDDAAAGHMATYLNNLRTFDKAGYKSLNALTAACKGWYNKPSSFVVKQEQAPRNPLANPDLIYGATHGDLHFIKTPTDKKSAWTLEKSAALSLMEAELRKHLGPLGTHSADGESDQGWTTFYVSGQHGGAVGLYKVTGERVHPSTTYFSMQVQVHYADNIVSYHGYPDEKMEGNATLGCKKTLKGSALT